MTYAGLDPGRTGALVHVGDDGRTVMAVQRWSTRKRAVPKLELRGDLACIVVERPFAGYARASLALAEWIGDMLTQMPTGVRVERAFAVEWRRRVIGNGSLDRETAKAQAVVAATLHGKMRSPTDDEAEAWCMAHYAWMVSRGGK